MISSRCETMKDYIIEYEGIFKTVTERSKLGNVNIFTRQVPEMNEKLQPWQEESKEESGKLLPRSLA